MVTSALVVVVLGLVVLAVWLGLSKQGLAYQLNQERRSNTSLVEGLVRRFEEARTFGREKARHTLAFIKKNFPDNVEAALATVKLTLFGALGYRNAVEAEVREVVSGLNVDIARGTDGIAVATERIKKARADRDAATAAAQAEANAAIAEIVEKRNTAIEFANETAAADISGAAQYQAYLERELEKANAKIVEEQELATLFGADPAS